MRRLVCHGLIVTAVLIGGDYHFNDGRDTGVLLMALRADLVAGRAQLQGHHFSESLGRKIRLNPAGGG